LKIFFLTTHLNSGGITSYLFTLTKGLIKQGHQVTIGSSGGNTVKDFQRIQAQMLALSIRTKSELSYKIYFPLRRLKRYILDNEIDIIHSQTRVTQVMGQLLKRYSQRPYISTCHGFFKTRLARKLFPCWGDGVIAISSAVQDHLRSDFHIAKQQIALIESGIDMDDFSLVSEDIKLQRKESLALGQDPLVGIIARLSDVKGQDVLIASFAKVIQQFPRVKLLIVGQGKTDEQLKQMVRAQKLEDYVIFKPVVNNTLAWLHVLDIFVMPSRQEGLGLSIMEAQAAGLPVIASKVGGIPSLIDDGETGLLVEPENIEDLSQAIVKLLKNKDMSRKIGLSARAKVKTSFSSERMVQDTINFYLSIIKNDNENSCC